MGESDSNRKSILYEDQIEVRFSELDPYGHLNAQHYLDYVLTSRWSFIRKRFGLTAKDFVKKGLGFFLNHFSIDFFKPISEGQTVTVQSRATDVKGEKILVEYTLSVPSLDLLFARGRLELTTINLVSLKPEPLPLWAQSYLFE